MISGQPGVTGKQFDISLLGIILSNLLTLWLALAYEWPVGQILWIYWVQSVTIGITNVIRILRLEAFTTAGMKMNGKPVPETESGKRKVAVFFAIHYGFFHLIYAIFLFSSWPPQKQPGGDNLVLLIAILLFAASHLFSLVYNSETDFKDKKPNLGTLMFYPYLRILPMHLTIIFGSMMGEGRIVLFMLLKTVSDAVMHMVEHALFRKT